MPNPWRIKRTTAVEACKNMSRLLSKRVHFDEEHYVFVLHSNNQSKVAKDHANLVLIALDNLDKAIVALVARQWLGLY